MEPIVIGANSSIQDGVVIHSKSGAAMTIGENTPVAHRPIVHEPCKVGNGALHRIQQRFVQLYGGRGGGRAPQLGREF